MVGVLSPPGTPDGGGFVGADERRARRPNSQARARCCHAPVTAPLPWSGTRRRSERQVAVELGVFVFPGRHAAKQALDEVRDRELAWIRDVAVVERPKRGPTSVHSTWAQN